MEDSTTSPIASKPNAASSLWAFPLLCLGLGLIGVCVLIPAADANRRLRFDRDQLQHDLTQVENQVSANQEFLADVQNDPVLLERLAQRQMRQIRAGTSVLEITASPNTRNTSPFELIAVPAAPAVSPYRPLNGILGDICRDSHQQLYGIGAGMMLVAMAILLGSGEDPQKSAEEMNSPDPDAVKLAA